MTRFIFVSYLLASTSAFANFPGEPGSDPWANRPNDPRYENMWQLFSHLPPGFVGVLSDWEARSGSGMKVDLAWQLHTGAPDTLIAILDSGIHWDVEDLVDRHFLNRRELPLPQGSSSYDANADGRFSVSDYATDSRVFDANNNGIVDAGDLIQIFSDGIDDDGNGYTDDIAGWDFHEHDNDPGDRMKFGHGTGEARDSVAAINNGIDGAGICGECSFVAIRVNDSFVIDANSFSAAVRYATDIGADLVQQALGSANWSEETKNALDYAYDRGMIVIGSAADENSYHHNYPSTMDPVIYANAIRFDSQDARNATTFVNFNNCSNYGARVDVAVSGTSCSSEATGNLSGITALAISYGKRLDRVLSPGEVTQLIKQSVMDINYGVASDDMSRHTTLAGWDTMTGYGRVDALSILKHIRDRTIPVEARILTPDWFEVFKQGSGPTKVGLNFGRDGEAVRATLIAYRGVEEEGSHPVTLWSEEVGNAATREVSVNLADFMNLELGDYDSYRNEKAVTFVLSVETRDGVRSQARRTVFNLDDSRLLDSFPTALKGSGESPGVFFDLNSDGRDEYIVGDGSGWIHAFEASGNQLPGFPTQGAVSRYSNGHASIYGGVAVGDLDGDGRREIVAATMEGAIVVINNDGSMREGFPHHIALPDYSEVNADNHIAQGIYATPVLSDLDRDGDLEIIVPGLDGKVHVLDHLGQMHSGFPVTIERNGRVAKLLSSPAVDDINGDGFPDMVFGSNHTEDAAGTVFAIDGRGRNAFRIVLQGFPTKIPMIRDVVLPTVGTGIPTAPVLADFDGDGVREILIHGFIGKAYLVRYDGRLKRSLQLNVSSSHETNDQFMLPAFGNPSVGDLDMDGILDPVLTGVGKRMLVNLALGGKRYPYHHMIGAWNGRTGMQREGFPKIMEDMQLTSSSIVADFTGDGIPDIAAASGGYFLNIYDLRNNRVQKLMTGGWIFGAISAGDMDGDGLLEIGATTREGFLFVIKTQGMVPEYRDRLTFKGGPLRHGKY